MPTYYRERVHVETSYEIYVYIVEAESEEEAQRIADNGDAYVEHKSHLHISESTPSDWDDSDKWEIN